ncbi:response regulator [bacterium]|jgi:two-component system response regulator RegA|nr:response regulator [bacterium]
MGVEPGSSFLLADDNDALRERLAKALRDRGYDVRTASDSNEAIQIARTESPEYAIVDLKMPGMGGLELLKHLKEIDPSTQVVILTGFGSIATAVDAMRLGATNYVTKPADADDVVNAFTPQNQRTSEAAETPSLARVEWEHIHRVLSDCSGNISEAARRLGIHRRSLQRKLQKLAPE